MDAQAELHQKLISQIWRHFKAENHETLRKKLRRRGAKAQPYAKTPTRYKMKPIAHGSMFVSIRELQALLGCGYETARRTHARFRAQLGRKTRYLTIEELADFLEVPCADLVQQLNHARNPPTTE